MKPLVFGAVLGLLLVLFGLPPVPVAAALAVLVQPVTAAFVLGILARPYLARWRTP